MEDRKFLTSSEAKVMRIIWTHHANGAITSDILKYYEDPKPAYTTLATFLKILTRKGFLSTKKLGYQLFYTPVMKREDYLRGLVDHLNEFYFEGDKEAMKEFIREYV